MLVICTGPQPRLCNAARNGAEPALNRGGPLDLDHRPQTDHRVLVAGRDQGDWMKRSAELDNHPVDEEGAAVRASPAIAGLDDRPAPSDDTEIEFGRGATENHQIRGARDAASATPRSTRVRRNECIAGV